MLKFDDRYKDIPILLISTTPENENSPHQVKTGIDKLLYKPFRFSALISALESMGEK
jgi:CheY-like chemotaxis protein